MSKRNSEKSLFYSFFWQNVCSLNDSLVTLQTRSVGQMTFTPATTAVNANTVISCPNLGMTQCNIQVAFSEALASGAEIGTVPTDAVPTGSRRMMAAGNDGKVYRLLISAAGKITTLSAIPAGTYLDIADTYFY